MKNKQELVIELLHEHLVDAKIGIIIKGVDDVLPEEIIKSLAAEKSHLYAATVGYEEVKEHSEEQYDITDSIEKAVLWRSIPQCAGSIIVFVRNDTDKLHSLAEFEVITTRDVARFLVAQQINKENNTPTNSFWIALQSTSDFYTFDALHEFVTAVTESSNPAEAIPQNMWRLNLLQDTEILGTKSKPEERLAKNRDLIFAIGQLSEDSRKKLSRSLVRTKAKDKDRLQKAYNSLQKLYKYGNRETLKALDLETVQELFSASQKSDKKKKKEEPTTPGETPETPEDIDTTPIRPKELDRLISDAVVFGDEEDQENIRDLLNELNKHYDTESEENDDSIPTIGGIFGDRNIVLENHQTDLRKLVGKFCSTTA